MVGKWSSKQKPDRAARVRENQRRCRAKTKAYIAELENEVAGVRSRLSEVLERNESLVAELEELRARLGDGPWTGEANGRNTAAPASPVAAVSQSSSSSTHTPTPSSVKRAGSSSPVPRATTSIFPVNRNTTATMIQRPCLSPSSTWSPSTSGPSGDPHTTPPGAHDDQVPGACNAVADDVFVSSPTIASLNALDVSSLRTSCLRLAPPCAGESTIPCGTAYGIIKNQNYNGYDLTTITQLLQPGFRGAILEGDDCRVMSSLVFAVLDAISSA